MTESSKAEPPDADTPNTAPPKTEFTILHRDDHLVIIDKPGGILVHRTAESRDRVFVLQLLGRQIDKFLYPIHRLDRATSGVLAFALSSEAAREFQASLQSATARKEYLVLVRGSAPQEFTVDRLLTDRDAPGRPRRPSRTDFVKIAEIHRSSLLRATIHTGRRHQIRRHLQNEAHHVIGDTTYGKGRINQALREEFGLPRLFLHACRLAIDHPFTGERLVIECPLAEDLRSFLIRLAGGTPEWLVPL